MVNKRLLVLLECAIFAAIGLILSLVPTDIGSSFSISLGMIPIYVIAIRRGFWAAGFTGLLWGLLHFVVGKAYILTPWQAVIEYVIAFVFVAFAGINSSKIRYLIVAKSYKKSNQPSMGIDVCWWLCKILLALCSWRYFLGSLCL